MGDGFCRSKDPTNCIKVLKEKATKENRKHKRQNTHIHTQLIDKKGYKYKAQQVP